MKCPKCHYISFDSSGRCRNCGYEFSLSVDVADVDLPIRTGDEAIGPLTDFPLDPPAGAESAAGGLRQAAAAGGSAQKEAAIARRRAGPQPTDLPLFTDPAMADDAPRVTGPVAPRPPLAVRRATPVIARTARTTPEALGLDLGVPDLPAHLRPFVSRGESSPSTGHLSGDEATPAVPATAGAASRLAAALVDLAILGSIDALILYFTLKICGLELPEIVVLPPIPLLAFLLLLDGAYLAAFTAASGQTIGKMMAGIRVVPASERSDRVLARHAALRAVAYLVSVPPAGLGLLPALFGADRRAMHDRLADTRVVKA